MIRENVLPVLVEKNLYAAAVVRSVAIVTEVSATDEKTKIFADRLCVRADALAARTVEISRGFIVNGEERARTERAAYKTEARALKLAAVPPHIEFYSAITKSCRRSVPEPGSRENAFLRSLEAADEAATFSLNLSDCILTIMDSQHPNSIISPAALRSISGFLAYSSEFFRTLAETQKVNYSVTELSPILSAMIAELSVKPKRKSATETATKLAAEAALSRITTA